MQWHEYGRLLGSLALVKGLLFILTLIGFGLAYLLMGNAGGRFLGVGLIVLGAGLALRVTRSFIKHS